MHTDTTLLPAGVWTVDPDRSNVGFTIRHLRVATVRGRFTAFAGRIASEDGRLTITGTVDPATVDTGEAIRDQRLREEFFRVAEYPVIAFEAGEAEPRADGEVAVHGTLTIRGESRPVLLGVTAEDAGDGAVRLRAEGEIRRSAFGLEWEALGFAGSRLVADRVRIVADVVVTA
jgi:polyisoprenoid-binding protein YceI